MCMLARLPARPWLEEEEEEGGLVSLEHSVADGGALAGYW